MPAAMSTIATNVPVLMYMRCLSTGRAADFNIGAPGSATAREERSLEEPVMSRALGPLRGVATLGILACLGAASYLIAQTRQPVGEWRHYSGDTDGAKYSALAQI